MERMERFSREDIEWEKDEEVSFICAAIFQRLCLVRCPGLRIGWDDLSDGAIARIRNPNETHAYKMLPRVRLRAQLVKRRKRFAI